MQKLMRRVMALIFSVILFFSLFFTAIHWVVYNEAYYEWHYKHRNIEAATGMNLEDLMMVTKGFIAYLKGDRDNLNMQATIHGNMEEVFGEREKAHMVDVKKLSLAGEYIRIYGGILAIMALLFALYKDKRFLAEMLSSIKYVFLTLTVLILGIGGLLLTDFNKYFTIFHEIFFSNDLWLLDPATDVLINMVPEIFFFTTAMLVIIIFIALTAAVIAGAEITRKKFIKS